jgi:uracil-DNA glycosylase
MYLDNSIAEVKTDWKDILEGFEFTEINSFLNKEHETYQDAIKIFPPKNLIFNCFNFFNINETKVVILGQDPYIKEGQAMGLSFSVPDGVRVPPSLRNIIKEINSSLHKEKSLKNGNLINWAEQGVLLLNVALTVRQFKSGSHSKIWRKFSDYIIREINKRCQGIVFMLWGNDAKEYEEKIDKTKHKILKSGHPSPLNTRNPFSGNSHFKKCNEILGDKYIIW